MNKSFKNVTLTKVYLNKKEVSSAMTRVFILVPIAGSQARATITQKWLQAYE
jgi:hypothetical protein